MSMDGPRVPADHGRGTEERSKVDRAQTGRVVRRKLSNRHDATITVKSLGRVSARNWRLADRNRCVDAVSWQPSSVASAGRPVVCLDVVPQQKVAVRQLRGDMRTFARAWGRSRSGFSGIFEIVAADEAGWSAEKRNPPARRTSIAAPRWPFATLGRPIYPRHPYLPKRAKGPENDAQPGCRPTDDPTVGAREASRVHWAKRLEGLCQLALPGYGPRPCLLERFQKCQ
jgi:hypothetical protein